MDYHTSSQKTDEVIIHAALELSARSSGSRITICGSRYIQHRLQC